MLAHGKTILALVGGVALLASCGGGGGSSSNGSTQGSTPGFYIVIEGMTYTPAELAVPPGATVTVLNRDNTLHSVTSEAASGDLTPGGVNGVQFDTGPFAGTASFTIPATASDGMAIPFYCTVHRLDMIPPNGAIHVDPNAQPAPAPGSTGTTGTGGGGGGGGGMY